MAAIAASPALVLASHQFDDVPNSNPFHGDIAALALAGVTAGCGGGNFCPDDFVTREQMAAFMNRLGALSAGKTPVVNARSLRGFGPSDLGRGSTRSTTEMSAALNQTDELYLDVNLFAPRPGFITVVGSLTGREVACTTACVIAAWIEQTSSGSTSPVAEEWVDERASLSMNARFQVEVAGFQEFRLYVRRPANGDGNVNAFNGSLTATFVPFDGSGDVPPAP